MEESIRAYTNSEKSLNGLEGAVSAKTVSSVSMTERNLLRLKKNGELGYGSVNLLSCMTLDVEHNHSTVHVKQANISQLEYAMSFGSTMRESVKRITK